jgi:hypothetical protein
MHSAAKAMLGCGIGNALRVALFLAESSRVGLDFRQTFDYA